MISSRSIPATWLRILAVACGLAVFVAPPAARAATLTWFSSGSTGASGGTGTWDTTALQWTADGSAWSAWNNAANDVAFFGGTAGTVTLNTAITANGLTFATTGYTVTGNTITLSLSGTTLPTITTNAGVSATVNSGLAGSNGLVKEGAGTLTFNSQKTYTGTTTINAGILSLTGGGGAAGVIRGTVNVNAGATLRLATNDATGYGTGADRISAINVTSGTLDITTTGGGGQNQTFSNGTITLTGAAITGVNGSATNLDFFSGSSALTTLASSTTSTVTNVQLSIRQSQGLTITVADGAAATDLLISSTIANNVSFTSAPLIKAGAGTLALAGINTYTGTTVINAGTLQLGNGGTTGSLVTTSPITGAAGATLAFNRTDTVTQGSQLNNVIGGSINVAQVGSGTLVLSASNTYTGTTTAAAGTILASGTGNLPGFATSGRVVFNGGIVAAQVGGSGWTTAQVDTLLTNATKTGGALGIDTTNGSLTQWTAFTTTNLGPGLGLAKLGSGTLTLNTANTYTGTTTVAGGVLSLADSSALGGGGNLSFTGGTLQYTGSNTVDYSARIRGSSAAISIDTNNQNVSYAGAIDSTNTAGLTKTGTGTLTLSGSNSYGGTTTVSTGTLVASGSNALPGFGSAGRVVFGGGTLQIPVDGTAWTAAQAGTLLTNATKTSGAIALDVASGSQALSTAFGGSINFIKLGSGTLQFTGANTYTGTTVVAGGRLLVTNTLLNTAAVTVTSGTAEFGATNVFVSGHGTAVAASRVLTADGPGSTLFMNSSMESRIGNVTLANGGVFTSNRALTSYDVLLADVSTGPATVAVTGTAAATMNGTGGIHLSGTQNFNVADVTGDANTDLTVSLILGAQGTQGGALGGVNKQGAGTMLASGANTYTGNTLVSAGTLKAGNPAAFGAANSAATAVVVSAGATLDVNGQYTNRGVTISGSGVGGLGALVNTGTATDSNQIQTPNIALAADATIGGTASFYMIASGYGANALTLNNFTLTKSGSNTFFLANTTVSSGTVRISGGTLSQFNTASTGSAADFVLDDTAGASLALNNLALSVGSLSGGGGTGGTVSLGSGTITIGALGTSTTYSGSIGGSGALIKIGSGTLTLAGTSGYSGPTTISAGVLQLGGGGRLGASGTYAGAISNAGLLNVASSAAQTLSGVISGTGALVKDGSGALTLSNGGNSFSGDITINSGTLVASTAFSGANTAVGARSGSRTITVNPGATMQWTINDVLVGSGGSASGMPVIVVNSSTFASTRFNAVGNVTLNSGAVLTQNSSDGPGTYEGYQFVGTLTVGGSTASTITTTNGKANHLLGGGTTAFNVADVTSSSAVDLTVSSPLRDGSGNYPGAGALLKSGAGTMLLTVTSSYSGGTIVNAGVLDLGGVTAGGTGVIRGTATVNAGAVLRLSTGDATGYNTDASRLSVINLVGGTLAVNTASNQTLGSATLNLTGGFITGTSTGNIDFFGGASTLNSLASSTTSVISGVRLSPLRQGSTTFTVAAGSAPGGIDLEIQSAMQTSASGDAAGGQFIKAGAGTLRITGSVTYGGTTAVQAGTLQVGGNGTTGSIQNATNVSAGALLAFNRSNAYTYSGTISGAGTISQIGSGTLTLTAANTYTGTTSLAAGVLSLGSTGALGSTGTISFSGGTLQFTAANTTDYAARIRNSSAAIQLDTNSQTVTFSGAVDSTNGSGLTKLGSGTLTLAAANTYAGNTTISAGVLQLGNGGSVAGTIVNNATLAVNRSDAYTLGNVISGSGGLVQAGSGTTTLSVVNSYSGATTVSGGMLSISQDANLGTAPGSATPGSIVISGGALSASAGFEIDARRGIALGPAVGSGTGTIDVAGALTTLTYGGVIADNAGGSDGLAKTGLGTLILAGTSSYSGNTAVNAGTLQVSGSLASPNLTVSGAATLAGTGAVNATTVSAGGILAPGVGGLGTLSLSSVTFSGSGTITMGVQGTAPSTLLNVIGGVTTLGSGSSVAFAFGNSLNSIGTGTYSLLSYGGTQLSDVSAFQVTGNQGARQGVNLENGTQSVNLVITNAFPIWSGANSTVWTGSDNWVLSGGGGPTTFLPNDTVVFDDSAATGTVTLTQNVDPATTTFSGTTLAYTLSSSGGFGITTGALVKNGPASLTISTSNSYSGGTTLSAGTILIGNDAAFGTGDVTVSGTASGITLESDGASPRTLANTLVVQNALTLGDPTNTGALTFTGTVNLGGSPRTLTTLSNATLSGLVTNGGIVKAGAGVLAITGSNAYAAGTTLSAGTLQVGNDAALGAGIVTLAEGVTLSANSATARSLANAFTINGNVTLGDAVNSGTLSLGGANGISLGGGSRQVTTPSNVTFAGAVTNGSLVKAGAGTLTLAAANSYSGGTTLSGGVIALGNTAALGSGTLTFAGDSAVRTALTGTIANVVALNSAVTGTFDAQSGTAALSGIVSGAGTLVKAGSGALTLAGPNTLTGTVSLAAGRLNLNTASALGTGSLVIAGSSTLDNTSGAAVTLTGPNAQAWNADFSFAGTNPLNLGTGAVTLGGNRQVTVTSSTLTVGGGIGGGFALTKAGAGTLSLTGAGNYSGGTTLSAGTLLVGNASALGTGTVALNAGTLFVNGVTAANDVILGGGAIDGAGGGTLSGVLSGGAQLSKTGTGTVALTGPSTFTGGIGINGGVLEASSIADGSPSAIGAGAGSTGFIGIQNATFRYTGATSATSTRSLWVDLGPGTIDVQNAAATLTLNPGGGTRSQNFTKAGAGTLVLGGDITGGAAVTVSAGVLALTASNSYTGGSTVAGGTLQLGAGGTAGSIAGNVAVTSTAAALAFNRSDAYSYSGLISGSGNVRQIGTGTTTLGGANTFSGVLTVAQGAVAVATINNASTSGALGNSANAVVLGSSNARGTLAYTGVTGTSSKAFTLATGGTGAIDVPTAVTLTLSGGIDGSGGFVKEGAGTLAFSTQKTYTGTTTVNAGVLSLTAGGASAGVIRGVVNVNPGATFRLAANDATGYGTGSDRISAINVTSGTLDITTTGGGGQNQTLGNCVITLQGAAITGVSGTTTNLDFFQGSSALTTLASSATSTVTNVALAIRQTGGLTITVADGAADIDLLVASRIYSNAYSDPLIKAGAGKMTLTALNGLAGNANTNVNAGTLAITGTGQLYDAYAGTAVVTIASGATLELDSFGYGTNGGLGQLRDYGDARLLRGGTISVLGTTQSTGNNFFVANGFSGAFNMTQAGQTLTLSGNNNTNIAVGGPLTFGGAGNITVNEVIENNTGAGSIIKAGLGTLTFGTAMTYTGSTTINTGTFVLTGAGQLGSGNYAGAFTNNAAFVTSATANQTLSGVVSGAGSFTKSGAGTLTLSNAASSFTGGVSLSAGVLSFVSGGLGSSGTVSLGGGTLQWAAGNTSDLSSRLALVNSTTTTLDIGSNNVTLANGIGAGSTASLVKTGGGALTLSASNGFTGGLAVSAGSVLVGNDAALGTGAVSLANGVALSSADTSARAIANAIAVNGNVTLGDATNTGALTFTGGMNLGAATRTLTTPSNVTIASAVSGAGGLTKAGAGSLTLSASNSYAGDTTINAGTLALSGAGDISASSAALVSIAPGAALDISAASGPRTIGELSGGDATSQVTLGGNTLRSVVTSLAGSFGGVISGSGGFTKAGGGTLNMDSIQSFTGPATVEAGNLLVVGTGLASAERIYVASGASIESTSGPLSIVANQSLGGYGTIYGDMELLTGGILSPGGSVGTLTGTAGTTTFNGGMRYLFEVNNASGTPGSDPGWDLFTTTGGLTLNITGTDQIFVDLTSLAGTSPGEAANFDPTFNYAWKFVVAGSEIGYQYAQNPTWFQVTTGAFQNTAPGSFYVARGDQLGAVNVSGGTSSELYVVYAAIPEPSTLALAGIGLAAAGWAIRRRRAARRG